MKERPILFSAPMVRAILEGRKTQTRRVVKPQPELHGSTWAWPAGKRRPEAPLPIQRRDAWVTWAETITRGIGRVMGEFCPYGIPGDRLWVRETWGLHAYCDFTYWNRESVSGRTEDDLRGFWEVAYAADAASPYDHWRPSIHMPRWASRITLEVTGVRVERLQDISDADAEAEGVASVEGGRYWRDYELPDEDGFGLSSPGASFCTLWCSINGVDSWRSNPWVWVIEFKRIEAKSEAA